MSKWRANSLGKPGIKDLGHTLYGIPKLSAKRKSGAKGGGGDGGKGGQEGADSIIT